MHLPGAGAACNVAPGTRQNATPEPTRARLERPPCGAGTAAGDIEGWGPSAAKTAVTFCNQRKIPKMLRLMRIGAPLVAVLAFAGLSPACHAATADQEKAFVDAYKQAYEAQDGDALKALLYSEGADPMALEFYGQMMTAEFGGTITEIGLEDLTADDVTKAGEAMPGPTGGEFVLAPKPYKKLVIKIHTKDANGKSTSTSESFVAETDGKLVISTPAPAP